jgi:hypothetical protein
MRNELTTEEIAALQLAINMVRQGKDVPFLNSKTHGFSIVSERQPKGLVVVVTCTPTLIKAITSCAVDANCTIKGPFRLHQGERNQLVLIPKKA